MNTKIKYRILILASIIFYIGDLNAVPADYEAVYSVKLMQADGTLRAKLKNIVIDYSPNSDIVDHTFIKK